MYTSCSPVRDRITPHPNHGGMPIQKGVAVGHCAQEHLGVKVGVRGEGEGEGEGER